MKLEADASTNYIVLVSIPMIIVIMIVSRIGVYKYGTANRHFGYELFLERFKSLHPDKSPESDAESIAFNPERIGWEEANRAWRIVQTAILRGIYKAPEHYPTKRKYSHILWTRLFKHLHPQMYTLSDKANAVIKNHLNPDYGTDREDLHPDDYPWFIPNVLATKDGVNMYHAGTYLENMLGVFLLLQGMLLIPGILTTISEGIQGYSYLPKTLLIACMITIIILRHIRVSRRREMIESEILSIHSCGILWHAVVVAHLKAVKKTKSLIHYTEHLADIGVDAGNNAFRIHKWIENAERHLALDTE
ncbi:hypothetical protein ACFL41_02295 [Gemmatimonadota bacterium]